MSVARSGRDPQEPILIGKHEATFEGDDFMVVRIHGRISVKDARGLALAERKIWANNDLIYMMVIVDDTTTIESGMLSEVKTLYAGRPPHVSVLVGASFTIRTVGSVINRAVRMFGRPSTLYFFNDEMDGRTWIIEDRQKRALEKA